MSSLAETSFDYEGVVWSCALLPYRIIVCRDAIHSASDGLFRGIKAGVMHFVMELLLRNEQKLKSSHLLSVTMSDIDLSRVRGSSRTHRVAVEALGSLAGLSEDLDLGMGS